MYMTTKHNHDNGRPMCIVFCLVLSIIIYIYFSWLIIVMLEVVKLPYEEGNITYRPDTFYRSLDMIL